VRTRALVAMTVLVAGSLLHGAAALSAQAPALPASAGVEVAQAKCIGCHEADIIVSQRLSPVGWDREVAKMERWGATLTADERRALVGYLTREFGVRPAVSHDPAAVAAGEAVFKEACRMCHDDDLSEQQRLSAAAWGREVDKMVRWGAKVSAEEKPALVAYLTSRWGQ
jgi:cytochrome c2